MFEDFVEFVKEFWWALLMAIIVFAALIVAIVLVCNGATAEFNVLEWAINPANPINKL